MNPPGRNAASCTRIDTIALESEMAWHVTPSQASGHCSIKKLCTEAGETPAAGALEQIGRCKVVTLLAKHLRVPVSPAAGRAPCLIPRASAV
mmetsp:Transcript_18044/g.46122  ORF Transcript_18044/g.46122 Transcript_18044/m.46122 type:complete len:92 (+) Transcript_18044:534-809(+)